MGGDIKEKNTSWTYPDGKRTTLSDENCAAIGIRHTCTWAKILKQIMVETSRLMATVTKAGYGRISPNLLVNIG